MPSRLYTRRGDSGETRLGDGKKIEKHSLRVRAYGTLYELNTVLGHARALIALERPQDPFPLWNTWESAWPEIMHRLFLVGGDLSGRHQGQAIVTQKAHTEALERLIDALRDSLPAWRPFTLPEGTPAATALYMATTVCRRAEREIFALHHAETVPQTVLMWVNRLSDLLFISGRFVNHLGDIHEEQTREPREY